MGHIHKYRMLQHCSKQSFSSLNLLLLVLHLLRAQKAEEEVLAREQSRQRALDAERERVAEMQRRQREQEQFSAFEEMIRRQELEKERQRVLLEFAKPATPSPDAPLIPGIQPPSLVSPSAPQGPGDLSTNHQYNRPPQSAGPPNFDRSLKPGSLFSPGNNSELIFLWYSGQDSRGFKYCPTPALKYLHLGAHFFPPDLLYYLLTPCLVPKHYKNPTLLSAFVYSFILFFLRYNGGCPSAAVRALWAVQKLFEVGWSQHKPGRRNMRHLVWQTGKISEWS